MEPHKSQSVTLMMSLIVHSSSHGAMFESVLKTALLTLGCVSYC